MKKILIFGNSGSGKSTLAKVISEQEGLAHLDLDVLAWQPSAEKDAAPQRKPIGESKQAIDAFATSNEGWVIEGCYTDLLELLENAANEIIFMNLPVAACQRNARQRPWEAHKYPSKAAQDANLPMLLDWIADYPLREDVFSLQSHQAFYDRFNGPKRLIVENL